MRFCILRRREIHRAENRRVKSKPQIPDQLHQLGGDRIDFVSAAFFSSSSAVLAASVGVRLTYQKKSADGSAEDFVTECS